MANPLAVATLIFKTEITPILNLKLHPFWFSTSKLKYYIHYLPIGFYATVFQRGSRRKLPKGFYAAILYHFVI
ncbi:MAG: hypothetical protein ACK518_00050 [bacterium]